MAPEISIKKSFSGAPDNKVYNYKECEKTKRCSKEFSGLKKISRQMSAFKTISRGSKEMIVLEIKFTIAQQNCVFGSSQHHKEEFAEERRLMTS